MTPLTGLLATAAGVVFDDRTINTNRWNGVFNDWNANIGHRSGSSINWTASIDCLNGGFDTGGSSHQTGDLATGWGKRNYCVFVQCFTKILKVKRFTTFYKGFYNQWKIFYKFNHILPANKYLEKNFFEEKLLSLVITRCPLKIEWHLIYKKRCNRTKMEWYNFLFKDRMCSITLNGHLLYLHITNNRLIKHV